MEHVNGWCFRGIYKGGLWENDLHVSARRKRLSVPFPSKLSQEKGRSVPRYLGISKFHCVDDITMREVESSILYSREIK